MTEGYEIRTELADMDFDRIHPWLSTDAYWAMGRTRDNVETAARHSLNFGVFDATASRWRTPACSPTTPNFGWLADVYVDRDHRGRGVGRMLMDAVVERLEPIGLKRVLLSTRDAHEVYARVGFEPLPHPEWFMVRS